MTDFVATGRAPIEYPPVWSVSPERRAYAPINRANDEEIDVEDVGQGRPQRSVIRDLCVLSHRIKLLSKDLQHNDSKGDEKAMAEVAQASWAVFDPSEGQWELARGWADKHEVFYEHQSKWDPLDNFT